MKVQDAGGIGQVDVAGPSDSKETRASRSASVTSDSVSTDSNSQIMAASTAALSALAGNHGLSLEAIAAAVRDGAFKPDPQRIAQKILGDAELIAMLQTMLHRG